MKRDVYSLYIYFIILNLNITRVHPVVKQDSEYYNINKLLRWNYNLIKGTNKRHL